jgi:hypothetical protein
MERVSFVSHRSKQVLVLDFSHISVADLLRLLPDAAALIRAQPAHSLLILTDVTDAAFDVQVTQALKDFTVGNKSYVKASAVVGVTGLKKIVYDAVMKFSGRTMPIFETIDKAKDWLVTQ